jgi:hypothetical protein
MDYLLEETIQFWIKTGLFLEWNRFLDNGGIIQIKPQVSCTTYEHSSFYNNALI